MPNSSGFSTLSLSLSKTPPFSTNWNKDIWFGLTLFPICRKVLDTLKFLITMSWEAKLISTTRCEEVAKILDETGKMFGGWRKNIGQIETKTPVNTGESWHSRRRPTTKLSGFHSLSIQLLFSFNLPPFRFSSKTFWSPLRSVSCGLPSYPHCRCKHRATDCILSVIKESASMPHQVSSFFEQYTYPP